MAGWHHQLDEQEFEHAWEMVKNREAQSATVHGVAKSQTRLNNKYPPPKSPQQIKRPPEGTHGQAQGVGPTHSASGPAAGHGGHSSSQGMGTFMNFPGWGEQVVRALGN